MVERERSLIRIGNKNSPIIIGADTLSQTSKLFPLDEFSQIGILTDANIEPRWLSVTREGIGKKATAIIVPTGEQAKTVEEAIKV